MFNYFVSQQLNKDYKLNFYIKSVIYLFIFSSKYSQKRSIDAKDYSITY